VYNNFVMQHLAVVCGCHKIWFLFDTSQEFFPDGSCFSGESVSDSSFIFSLGAWLAAMADTGKILLHIDGSSEVVQSVTDNKGEYKWCKPKNQIHGPFISCMIPARYMETERYHL